MKDKSTYLFGAGKVLKAYSKYFRWDSIIAILDNGKENIGKVINGRPVICPCDICFRGTEKVIICVKHHIGAIVSQLLRLGIPMSHIQGIGNWLKRNYPKENIVPYETTQSLYDYAGKLGCGNIIQVGNLLAREAVYFRCDGRLSRWVKESNNEIAFLDVCGKDNVKRDISPLLSMRYYRCDDVDKRKYDAAIISGTDIKIKLQELKNLIAKLPVNYVIVDLSVILANSEDDYYNVYNKIVNLAAYEITEHRSFVADFIDINMNKCKKNKIGIYVVSHKEFDRPPMLDNGYHTIWVGSNAYRFKGLKDNVGDNIASINPVINECTAIYWLWKNCHDNYIGICHYRRFFLYERDVGKSFDNILGSEEAISYLDEYDIIVSEPSVLYQFNGVKKIMTCAVNPEAVNKGVSIIRKCLRERQPDYLDLFEKVMSGVMMFPCNMMVTPKRIFDKYAEWLFSFLIDAAKKFNPAPYDDYSKRIIGFIAERMLTVWLLKQNFKIKILPVLLTE